MYCKTNVIYIESQSLDDYNLMKNTKFQTVRLEILYRVKYVFGPLTFNKF